MHRRSLWKIFNFRRSEVDSGVLLGDFCMAETESLLKVSGHHGRPRS